MSAKNQKSLLAVAVLVAVGASLMGMRSTYQERRRKTDIAQARAVTEAQLEAFKQSDFERAFSLAASGFHQGMTVTRFRKLVEESHPELAYAREFHLGQAHRAHDGAVIVEVQVTDKDGRSVPQEYTLWREGDAWKVVGVNAPGSPPVR